ncbi:hypothetical protein [Sedimentitalea arenosa]|uniref:hypothetical protein n=1 Tax=Sedimentitalea arenosa TaxID=2798803 RepID=UPI001E5FA803|nr:hypothetical protein [Arenibacterium arenosum]
MPAIITQHEAAQREVLVDVLARWSLGSAVQSPLDFLIGRKADQRFVLSFAGRNVPFRGFDVPGISQLRENAIDPLPADFSGGEVFGEGRLALQEALHLALRLQVARSKAFERLR